MQESRTSQVKTILGTILSDEQAHSFEELLDMVTSADDSLLTSPNMLSSILSRMVKTDPRIIRVKRGYFQYIPIDSSYLMEYIPTEDVMESAADAPAMSADEPSPEASVQVADKEADDMSKTPARIPAQEGFSAVGPQFLPNLPVTQLHQILNDIDRRLKMPDYEMEEAEFRANKKLYLIKTHLQAILLLCSELS